MQDAHTWIWNNLPVQTNRMALGEARHLNRYQRSRNNEPINLHDDLRPFDTIEHAVVEEQDDAFLYPYAVCKGMSAILQNYFGYGSGSFYYILYTTRLTSVSLLPISLR